MVKNIILDEIVTLATKSSRGRNGIAAHRKLIPRAPRYIRLFLMKNFHYGGARGIGYLTEGW